MPPAGETKDHMSPEKPPVSDPDGTQTPAHPENLARLAVLKERNARLH
jgi:hypothetical protein